MIDHKKISAILGSEVDDRPVRALDGQLAGSLPPPEWRPVPLYSVGTWDTETQAYTPQEGLTVPSQNIPLWGLLEVIRQLRAMGYNCHRRRDPSGSHDDNDWSVLIERTDGAPLDGARPAFYED